MDLPMILETREFVPSGIEELKQFLEVCLRQPYGTILQDVRYGTDLDVHEAAMTKVKVAVRNTLNSVGIYDSHITLNKEGEVLNIGIEFTYQSKNHYVSLELEGKIDGII